MPRRLILTISTLALFAVTAALAFAVWPGADEGGGDCDGGAVSRVPELEDGVLSVGSDLTYPPIDFIIPGTETPDGLDIDLAEALADNLCVDTEFIQKDFGKLIGSLQAEEFDILMAAMTITDERSEEIDFVPYAKFGTSILVRTNDAESPRGFDELCGRPVAVVVDTIHVDLLKAQNESCEHDIDVLTFEPHEDPDPPEEAEAREDADPQKKRGPHDDALVDLVTGGSDAYVTDFPAALVAAAESNGRLELLDVQIDRRDYGIGVRKESKQLKEALGEVLENLMDSDSGLYDEILETWNLSAASLTPTPQ